MLNKNIIKKKSSKDSLRKNNEKKEKHDNSINYNIFQIIENNNLNKLSELLKKDHSKINILNKEGFSPLHISVIKGNLDLLTILLLNGANPNILTSKKRQTPLHLAYIYQNSNKNEIIKKLKKYKAKENIYDINNKKPIDYLIKKSIDKNINISECNIFKNKKSNINEKRNKSNNFIENKNKNRSINTNYNNFQKFNFKIEGDIDNCEKDDNDFNNNDLIKKKYYYEINLKNNNQKNKNEKNIINKENTNETDDIIISSFNDSLENDYKPKKNKNKKNKVSNQSRNNSINEKNNLSSGYPIILNNMLKNKINYENKNKNEFIENKTHKYINSNNDINNFEIDKLFKEIIKNKRQSLKLKKSNSFFRIKKNNTNIDNNNIFLANNQYLSNSNTEYNIINENFQSIKSKDKYHTNKTSSLIQNNTGFMSAFSTENQTKNRNTKDKVTIITNKDVVEFKYGDSFTEDNTNTGKKSNTNNNTNNNSINITNNTLKKKNNVIKINNTNNISNNTSFNVLNKDSLTYNENYTNVLTNKNINKINTDINDPLIEKSLEELKLWLDNIDLSIYYENFQEANIYDINKLINQMKDPENKLGYEDIETILKIHKPGHIYRILCNLEIDAGLIKENVVKFLIKKNKNKNNNIIINNNKLKLSISQENNSCNNCYRISFLSSKKKYDLKSFLTRNNLLNFYQNFYHNGFNLINFVMIQMYSSEPIDEIILENCFHIYEPKQREIVLKSIIEEKNKINIFLNSYEYLNFEYKDIIKYEDITFDENENNENGIIKIPNNNSCTECIII